MSYTIEFYITKNGEVLIWEFLEKLRKKSKNDKNARIQYRQISLYIELLQRNGVNLNENIIKHLEDGIWELRPGVNRIFFFYFESAVNFFFTIGIAIVQNFKQLFGWRIACWVSL